MACSITILSVKGVGVGPDVISVQGASVDCAPQQIEGGGHITVKLECGDPFATIQTQSATVLENGDFFAEFESVGSRCPCGGPVRVTATCASEPDCFDTFIGELACAECPSFINPLEDVTVPSITDECEVDGSARIVTIGHFVRNLTGAPVVIRINCGPDQLGPQPANTTPFAPGEQGQAVGVCRYAAPSAPAAARIIVLDAAEQATGCPPVVVNLPEMEPCEVGCPTTVVLEVLQQGEVVDPSGVVCLAPGDYEVRVVSPNLPGTTFGWSVEAISTGETSNTLGVTLNAGDELDVSVAVLVPDCPLLPASVVLKACTLDCPAELTVVVRDDASSEVDLEQDCIAPGTYVVVVTNPVPPPWKYAWTIDGVLDTATNGPSHQVVVQAGTTTTVRVEASAVGCETRSIELQLVGCGDDGDEDEGEDDDEDDEDEGDDNGGGSFSCDGLLIAAITAIVVGGILLIIGICSGIAGLVVAGTISAVLGAALLVIWAIFCRKTTSCEVLAALRCLMSWLAVLVLLASILLLFVSSPACAATAALTGVSWGGIAALLTDAMVVKGCQIGTCFLPPPVPLRRRN